MRRRLLARIAEVEKRPPPKETVEGLLATPFSTPEEAKPFLGTWVGETWHNADEPHHPQTLRIAVENGRVVGETIYPTRRRVPRPGLGILPRHPGGDDLGEMNGMRPRGVILYEGHAEGGHADRAVPLRRHRLPPARRLAGTAEYFTFQRAP
jgi:hypothetical protein